MPEPTEDPGWGARLGYLSAVLTIGGTVAGVIAIFAELVGLAILCFMIAIITGGSFTLLWVVEDFVTALKGLRVDDGGDRFGVADIVTVGFLLVFLGGAVYFMVGPRLRGDIAYLWPPGSGIALVVGAFGMAVSAVGRRLSG